MQDRLSRKTLVLGVVILFVSVTITPGSYAYIRNFNNFYSNREESNIRKYLNKDVVEILVTEYKSDRSIKKNIVELSRDQLEELNEKLKEVRDSEEKLNIYKNYKLIPQDVSLDQINKDMHVNGKHIDFNHIKTKKINIFTHPLKNIYSSYIEYNVNCNVEGVIMNGMKYLFGISALTSIINFIFWLSSFRIKSIDLLDLFVVEWGKLDAVNGTMPDIHTQYGFMLIILLGFVGYCITYPPIPGVLLVGEFVGSAAFVIAMWAPGVK